jgi:hypothetical protein
MAKIVLVANGVPQDGPEYDNGNSGSSITIDWRNGNSQVLTLTANCSITLTGRLTLGTGYDTSAGGANYTLKVKMGSGGPYTITFTDSANMTWGFFGEPDLTPLVTNQWIIIGFRYDSDSMSSMGYVSGYGP